MSYRYLGNKTRIADWIVENVNEHLPTDSTISDPMCGTATMSEAFARNGMTVTASDILKFPVLHAKARLLHKNEYNFLDFGETYSNSIDTLNNLEPKKDFFWNEYSDEGKPKNGSKPRLYFSGSNAAKIDAIRLEIKKWRQAGLEENAADLLLHDLILSINDVANITGTYGYFRSKLSPQSLKPITLKPSELKSTHKNHVVLHGKVEDIVKSISTTGCYLDPPYTKRQYGGNYHILETIAQEDYPEPAGEGGLRSWITHASDFCYKRNVREAFIQTLDALQSEWLFISYSDDAHIPANELLEILETYGRVERREKPLGRFKSNSKGAQKKEIIEHLYIIKR